MKIFQNLTRAGLLLLFCVVIGTTSLAQQKRMPVRGPQKAAQTAQPVPTFDTLLAADRYKIYGEIRGVGQVIRSGSVNELLEPIMKLAAPPKEFKTLVKWLNTHADPVLTSRMLFAGWPTGKNLPDMLVVIEFESAEEAAKFEPQLNQFLPKVFPPPATEDSSSSGDTRKELAAEKPREALPATSPVPPKPNYYLKQAGPLLFITSSPLTLKNLRPPRSKLLAEDPNFRIIHDRFSSEAVFLYLDVKGMEKEEEERRKQYEEEMKKHEAEAANQKSTDPTSESDAASQQPTPEGPPPPMPDPSQQQPTVTATLVEGQPVQAATVAAGPTMIALPMLGAAFFSGETKWPEAVGLALAFDATSFDVRALLVNAPDVKGNAIPFIPQLVTGPALVPESPSILPDDTEMFAVMSLDLPQMYAGMSKPASRGNDNRAFTQPVKETEIESPFAQIEKKLGLKIKDDLLPLLGNEVVFSMPVKGLGRNATAPPAKSEPKPGDETAQAAPPEAGFSPIIALSLRDKEGMRVLMPRIIDALGFKGASALAHTEKREDTEIVSYANLVAYAFIGNFLVLSPDVAATRHVVDSYLKNETLSGDGHYKNYTRWQPRQLQGQFYVSPALMESYKSWANQPSEFISDQTREFLMRLSVVAEPITYSLSNEGLGPLHELHVPKNLILMAVAGFAGETNQPPLVSNERSTSGVLSWMASAEATYSSGKGAGSYATLDQLIAEKLIPRDVIENHGYKIEVMASDNKFEITAVPIEYGKTGRRSFFVDESKVVRGGDHGGGPATISDKPVQ